MNPAQISDIVEWIVAQGLTGTPEIELLPGLGERMNAAGLPVLRANLYQPTLHPIIGGHIFYWWRGETAGVQEDWDRDVSALRADERMSPFEYMIFNKMQRFHLRIDSGDLPAELPLLRLFRDRRGTDYFAIQAPFGKQHTLGPVDRILCSWLTDAPGGFSEADVSTLTQIARPLALAAKGSSTYRIARSVIQTYLGRDAGRRVLSGAIERGSGTTIRAALWSCDLQGFTRLADKTPRDALLGLLDDYFECMVNTLHEHEGQVLKFMGDGLLAIFDLDDDAKSCHAALCAAERAMGRVATLTAEREAAGLPVSDFYIALHLGEVMYGNIGARNRLDFTVVGPAVNEVSRIEAMCRALDQTLVISSAFAEAATDSRDALVSLGRYALRGVRRPQALYTLAPPEDDLDTPG